MLARRDTTKKLGFTRQEGKRGSRKRFRVKADFYKVRGEKVGEKGVDVTLDSGILSDPVNNMTSDDKNSICFPLHNGSGMHSFDIQVIPDAMVSSRLKKPEVFFQTSCVF